LGDKIICLVVWRGWPLVSLDELGGLHS